MIEVQVSPDTYGMVVVRWEPNPTWDSDFAPWSARMAGHQRVGRGQSMQEAVDDLIRRVDQAGELREE